MSTPFYAVVLAGGKGTRLKSSKPKVLHTLFDKPLLQHVLDSLAQGLGKQLAGVFVITGHEAEQVKAALDQWSYPFSVKTVHQQPQLGTGHAVQQVLPVLPTGTEARVLVLSGDVPLLRADTLKTLAEQRDDLTVVSAHLEQPTGYGRVIPLVNGGCHIVEEKDATDWQKQTQTVNAGLYQLWWPVVAPLLKQLTQQNAQNEYYLTDLVMLASQAGHHVTSWPLLDPLEMTGVNTRADLSLCHQHLQARINAHWQEQGVTLIDPQNTWISSEVKLEPDVTLYPGCWLTGEVHIAAGTILAPYTVIRGPVSIGEQSRIGPFAHLRDDVQIADHVRVGNFVEVKHTQIGAHTNAAHLAYLGDAMLGTEVNVGAGVITANYDPITGTKSTTVLEDGVKVGSNSVLVAPVTAHEHANIAAGSVITQDVPAGNLAIARVRQVDIPGWVEKKRQTYPFHHNTPAQR